MAPAPLSVRRTAPRLPDRVGCVAAQNGSGWRAPYSLAPRVYTAKARRTDIPTGPAVTDVPIDLRLAAVDPTSVAIGSAGHTRKRTVLGATPGNGVRPRGASILAGATVLKVGKTGTRIATEGESSRTGAAAVGARRARRSPPLLLIVPGHSPMRPPGWKPHRQRRARVPRPWSRRRGESRATRLRRARPVRWRRAFQLPRRSRLRD